MIHIRRGRILLALASALSLLAGCGGGGGPSGAGPSNNPSGPPAGGPQGQAAAPVKVDVLWPDRSRAANAPSSALSALVLLRGAGPGGGDCSFGFDRDSALAAHTTQYTSSSPAAVGAWPMKVTFYASPGGAGAVVGVATLTVSVASDGTLKAADGADLGAITPSMTVQSIQIADGQSVKVGETKDLSFVAHDSAGAVVAITPGSVTFHVADASPALGFVNGQAVGLAPGLASIVATVDGQTSPAASVSVTSDTMVAVNPPAPTISVGAAQQFTATVTGQPAGAASSVAWSVQEGSAGGSISSSGLYTAPRTAGVYHIVATSQYDGAKSAVATVTVQAGGASGVIQ